MKKNVAGQTVGAQLINKADGTPCTSGATDVYITGDGGTQTLSGVSPSGAVHEGNGYWSYPASQADTNFDHVAFTFVNSSAINATVQVYTSFPQTGDNFARLGAPAGASHAADVAAVKVDTAAVKVQTDKMVFTVANHLDVNTLKWNGGTIPTVNVTGVPLVDLKYTLGTISPATAGSVRADAVTGAVGSVTGNVGGNVTGSVGSVASGGIAASSFAAGAIDAAAIAADAIGSSELAASAVTEIQAGLATASAQSAIQAVTDLLNSMIEAGVGSPTYYRYKALSLEQAPSGTGASAVSIADEVQTRTIAGITDKAGFSLASAYDFAKGTVAMAEAYAADGATMTPVQAFYMLWALFAERGLSGTTLTAKKLDGSTNAMTFTLDSATDPTSQTRAT